MHVIFEDHLVEPSELMASDRPIGNPAAGDEKSSYRDVSAMNDHFPSMSQFCLPPRLHPHDSSFCIISNKNLRPKQETQVGVAEQRVSHVHTPITKPTARLKRKAAPALAVSDLERCLALRRYTARSHRHPAPEWSREARVRAGDRIPVAVR